MTPLEKRRENQDSYALMSTFANLAIDDNRGGRGQGMGRSSGGHGSVAGEFSKLWFMVWFRFLAHWSRFSRDSNRQFYLLKKKTTIRILINLLHLQKPN